MPVFSFLKQHLPRGRGWEDAADFDLPRSFQKSLVGREGVPLDLFPRIRLGDTWTGHCLTAGTRNNDWVKMSGPSVNLVADICVSDDSSRLD